jgi:hypothetical protein
VPLKKTPSAEPAARAASEAFLGIRCQRGSEAIKSLESQLSQKIGALAPCGRARRLSSRRRASNHRTLAGSNYNTIANVHSCSRYRCGAHLLPVLKML